jgi:hypothetical protein
MRVMEGTVHLWYIRPYRGHRYSVNHPSGKGEKFETQGNMIRMLVRNFISIVSPMQNNGADSGQSQDTEMPIARQGIDISTLPSL